MLGKLIKHDFNSLSRVLLPTQLAVIGATIIATAGFAFNMRTNMMASMQGASAQFLRFATGFISGMMLIAIMASALLIAFIIFQRFYKNFMCDEGYLTFTLPVTVNQLLWSKLITAMLWTIISGLVIFLCVNIFIIFGTSREHFANFEIYRQFGEAMRAVFGSLGGKLVLPCIEFVIFIVISLVFGLLHIYLSLIIGGVVSQKHKLLAGIGFYFAINIGVGILASLGQFIISGNMVQNFDLMPSGPIHPAEAFSMVFNASQPFIIYNIILTAVLAVGFFVLSHYLLKNKLNLE